MGQLRTTPDSGLLCWLLFSGRLAPWTSSVVDRRVRRPSSGTLFGRNQSPTTVTDGQNRPTLGLGTWFRKSYYLPPSDHPGDVSPLVSLTHRTETESPGYPPSFDLPVLWRPQSLGSYSLRQGAVNLWYLLFDVKGVRRLTGSSREKGSQWKPTGNWWLVYSESRMVLQLENWEKVLAHPFTYYSPRSSNTVSPHTK